MHLRDEPSTRVDANLRDNLTWGARFRVVFLGITSGLCLAVLLFGALLANIYARKVVIFGLRVYLNKLSTIRSRW